MYRVVEAAIAFDFLNSGCGFVGAFLLVRVGSYDPDYSIFSKLRALLLEFC
jgi:hypothetical protein